MLMGSMEGSKSDREDAKNMAILQAGLAIAGGSSPNAFQNISAGALPATQQYQQQMSQLRKDDRGNIKELANMELGRQKLSVEEQRHKDQMAIAKMQVDAMRDRYSGAAAGASGSKLQALQLNAAKAIMAQDYGMDFETAMEQAAKYLNMGISGSGGNTSVPIVDFSKLAK
jgi:chromosome segregation ATPase